MKDIQEPKELKELKEKIRMELYKGVYLLFAPMIPTHTKNVAEYQAELAVKAFDKQFNP